MPTPPCHVFSINRESASQENVQSLLTLNIFAGSLKADAPCVDDVFKMPQPLFFFFFPISTSTSELSNDGNKLTLEQGGGVVVVDERTSPPHTKMRADNFNKTVLLNYIN